MKFIAQRAGQTQLGGRRDHEKGSRRAAGGRFAEKKGGSVKTAEERMGAGADRMTAHPQECVLRMRQRGLAKSGGHWPSQIRMDKQRETNRQGYKDQVRFAACDEHDSRGCQTPAYDGGGPRASLALPNGPFHASPFLQRLGPAFCTASFARTQSRPGPTPGIAPHSSHPAIKPRFSCRRTRFQVHLCYSPLFGSRGPRPSRRVMRQIEEVGAGRTGLMTSALKLGERRREVNMAQRASRQEGAALRSAG